MPRWFTLTVDQQTGFPAFQVAHEAHLWMRTQRIHDELVAAARKEFNLAEGRYRFAPKPGDWFGFGQSLKQKGRDADSITYISVLPSNRLATDLGAVTSSISLFARLLWLARDVSITTATVKHQFLDISLSARNGSHGYSFNGSLSPAFIQASSQALIPKAIQRVNQAMRRVYQYMAGQVISESTANSIYLTSCEPGKIRLEVPGNGCCLYTTDSGGSDWTYHTHNVDTAFQQLTLLTGLAAVCDELDQAST